MAFNGAGIFTVTASGYPVVYGEIAEDPVFNNIVAELAAGLSQTITKDGQSVVTQNTPWNGKLITNLGDAGAVKDALNGWVAMTNKLTYAASVGGTVDAITIGTLSATDVTYTEGLHIWFKPTGANTGAVTVNINGLGAKNLTRTGAVALSASDLQTDSLACIMYDGTQFQLVSPYYAQGTWTPSVGGDATYTTQIGHWRKVGAAVFVHARLVINVLGTGSTTVISGLPFTSANTVAQALSVGDFTSLANTVVWIGARVDTNATTISMRSLTAAAASTSSTSIFGDAAALTLSGCYFI